MAAIVLQERAGVNEGWARENRTSQEEGLLPLTEFVATAGASPSS